MGVTWSGAHLGYVLVGVRPGLCTLMAPGSASETDSLVLGGHQPPKQLHALLLRVPSMLLPLLPLCHVTYACSSSLCTLLLLLLLVCLPLPPPPPDVRGAGAWQEACGGACRACR